MRGLDRALFRLTLVCAEEMAEQLHPDMPEDVEVIPLRLRHAAHLAGALALARILWTRRVNILHSHLFSSSLFASPIGRLCQVPVILETPHCREDSRRGWKVSFTVDQAAGRFVDYYIAVSEANARYLIGEKDLPARKVVVIPNGCDLARFDPMQAAPVGLKQSLGFEEDDPVLLVVGRLEPQ
ncbi:MAG: glycosyltransferase, partial [Dehalococcoidia bacterium]